jgi:hypothetical protein
MGWVAFWGLLVFINGASVVAQTLQGKEPWWSLGTLIFSSVVLGTYLRKEWDES